MSAPMTPPPTWPTPRGPPISTPAADSILLAPTNDIVDTLNARARLDRLAAADPKTLHGNEIILSDKLAASPGDLIRTRRNARRIHIGRKDYVRNGYRYQIIETGDDGSIKARHLGSGTMVRLPADYVKKHVTLGYAATIDSAQGLTAGHACHIVGAGTLTRQLLYVALTRGRVENHIYLSTAESDPHRVISPKATHPETAVDVLSATLRRDGAQISATTAAREAADPFARLGPAAAMYYDALGEAAHQARLPRRAGPAAHHRRPALPRPDPRPSLARAVQAPGHHRRRRPRPARRAHRPPPPKTSCSAPMTPPPSSTGASTPPAHTPPGSGRCAGCRPPRPCSPTTRNGAPTWAPAPIWSPSWPTRSATPSSTTGHRPPPPSGPNQSWPPTPNSPPKSPSSAPPTTSPPTTPACSAPRSTPCAPTPSNAMLEHHAQAALRTQYPHTRRFEQLIDSINPRIRADGHWPQLAARLAQAATSRPDLPTLVRAAAAAHPLPDELPAAALWWRLSAELTSKATLDTPHTALRPAWITDLHNVFGSAAAEAIIADPAWPGLVSAVNAADPTRWTPADLLNVAAEHLADIDPDHTIPTYQYARAITYTVDLFAGHHDHPDRAIPDHAPLHPEDEEQFPPDPATPQDRHARHRPHHHRMGPRICRA